MLYTKSEAIKAASEFLNEIHVIEKKYGLSFNSDKGDDIYLSYKTKDDNISVWDNVKIGWTGNGTGLKVLEKNSDQIKKQALLKLTDEEKEALGL